MNIENRMSDVIKLRSNACQDLLKMLVCENWKDKFYKCILEAVTPYSCTNKSGKIKHSNNYNKFIEAYRTIKNIGLEKYSIDMMDVTLINAIINDTEEVCNVNDNIKKLMKVVSIDRNLTVHSSSNESAIDLYVRALISLNDVKALVCNAYDSNLNKFDELKIDESIYDNYRIQYYKKINDLQEIITEECAESIGMDHLVKEKIDYCLRREDEYGRNERFRSIAEKWQELYSINDRHFYIKLLRKGYEANISESYFLYEMALIKNGYDSDWKPVLYNDKTKESYDIAEKVIIKHFNSKYRIDLAECSSKDFLTNVYKSTGRIDLYNDLINKLKELNIEVKISNNEIEFNKK